MDHTSVIMIDGTITGQCTCGRTKTIFARNTKTDNTIELLAYKTIRELFDRHWWRKHGKIRIYGPKWKRISSIVPPKTGKHTLTFDDYYGGKIQKSAQIKNSITPTVVYQ